MPAVKGKAVLVRTRWIWLKSPVNLTTKQRRQRKDILVNPVNLNLDLDRL